MSELEAATPMSPVRRLGGYGDKKNADTISKNVLKAVEPQINNHKELSKVDFKHILDNHQYSKQVVAGTNYKFHISPVHEGKKGMEFVVWHKLNGDYILTHVDENHI